MYDDLILYVAITSFFVMVIFVLLLYKKTRSLKIFRKIKQTTIKNAKRGFVEINGKAYNAIGFLDSPLTKTKCVWYKYKVERENVIQDTDGNAEYNWELVDEGQSYNLIKISDSSGECLVNVAHSRVDVDKKKFWIGYAIDYPKSEENREKINKLYQKISSFNNTRYKYTEELIEPYDIIYVSGLFRKYLNIESPFQKKNSFERKSINKKILKIKKLKNKKKELPFENFFRYKKESIKDLIDSIKIINNEWSFYLCKNNKSEINYLSHKKNPCLISSYSQKRTLTAYKAIIISSGVCSVLSSAFLIFTCILL